MKLTLIKKNNLWTTRIRGRVLTGTTIEEVTNKMKYFLDN